MFEYIDIHSHLYFLDFDTDRSEEIEKIKNAGIATITIGTDFDSSKQAIDLANTHSNLFACVGQHPGDISLDSAFDSRLKQIATDKKVVAIGECGFDYFRLPSEQGVIKKIQEGIFEEHIDLSLETSKPLMLHIRSSKNTMDAYHDSLSILEHRFKTVGDKLRGNAHFFAGDMNVLKRFLAIGFTVSFTGVVTFTTDYDEFVRYTPPDMMMSETDAPFVAPVPYRGGRNSPLYVPEVVRAIARIRNEDFEMVKTTLRDNAVRHFGIS